MGPAARAPPLARLAEVAQVTRRMPAYLLAEQQDRGSFMRAVYRRYRGLDLAELERRVDTTMTPAHPAGSPPRRCSGSASTAGPGTPRS